VVPYRLLFKEPYVTSRGRLDHREMALLRIRLESGARGLGEAVPLSLRGGDALAAVCHELDLWGNAAVAGGEPPLPGSPPARCAVLTALGDASAREQDLPLHRLLDQSSEAAPIRCNATLGSGSPGEVVRQAEDWAAHGFTCFKLKVGPDDDLEQVRAVRRALGPDAGIRIDVNGSWSLERAVANLEALEGERLELAEQPVATIEEMAELRPRTTIPLVADESVAGTDEARKAASLAACDAVTVKLSKTGSLDPALGGYLPTYLSSALDGPVGIAAAAHVAVTMPPAGTPGGLAHGLATSRLFSSTVAEEAARLEGPLLHVPGGPGLGVSIDEAALELHRL
jgi:L-alanine-DL-glutamate epimerase-like enolase superfamily enzyme